MSYECTKALGRRLREPAFENEFFVGQGIDIGAGSDADAAFDGLSKHLPLFPRMQSCRNWDKADGDAQFMPGLTPGTFDFVHSSHCLEHMVDPYVALQHWFAILKPGGHLVVTVPDEDLYEQGQFPSTYNYDHKWTFTIHKAESWSPVSINLSTLLAALPPHRIKRLLLCDGRFDYGLSRRDQTLLHAESAIEFVVQKL